MLQDPSNLDVAFEYASLSSQVGDYEAAISTLERMHAHLRAEVVGAAHEAESLGKNLVTLS